MSMRSWNRRDFGKVAGLASLPALLGVPGASPGAMAAGPGAGWPELWPEAWLAIDFYREHLPPGYSLARPAASPGPRDRRQARSVLIPVMAGGARVGQLGLNAAFRADQPARLLWQSTVVEGGWYQASIANAFRAGAFA